MYLFSKKYRKDINFIDLHNIYLQNLKINKQKYQIK